MLSSNPPKIAQKLLEWFIKDELVEEVLGDLDEKYYSSIKNKSTTRAKLNYWYQVLHYLRPFAIKNYWSNSNFNNMHLHHFKIGFRSLNKNKGYSFLNILGLTLGMTIALFIGLWVHDELSFNKSFNNYENIAKVMRVQHNDGQEVEVGSVMPPGLGTHLRENFSSQFEHVVIARSRPEEVILSNEGDNFTETGLFLQKDGPELFSVNMLSGSRAGLTDINSILISHKLAQKLFDDEDPVGKTIKYNGSQELAVNGVYEDFPTNSALKGYDFLAPFELYIDGWSDVTVWDNYFTQIFVLLPDNANLANTNELIKDLLQPHVSGPGERLLFVEPMKNWHLFSEYENGEKVLSQRLKFVWIIGLVGVFVLALACINFINLSTARSEKRALEIGVRKSVGSRKGQLIHQFLIESLIIAFISFGITIILSIVLLPAFNGLAGKNIQLPFYEPLFWLISLGTTMLTGIIAGAYPAFYLSSISPIKSLKGDYKTSRSASLPRKILVIFQFTISITLICGTLVIYNQIQFVKSRPVGYGKTNLVTLQKRTSELYGKYDVLQAEFEKSGAVESIGEASYPLTNTLGNNDGFDWEGKDPSFDPSFNTVKVNYDYGKVVQWEIIEGRDFSRDIRGDVRKSVIITEAAKEIMGFDEAVGKQLKFNNDFYSDPEITIVGVVKDMVKGNPFEKAKPAIMFLTERPLYWMFLRLNSDLSTAEAITRVENVIREVAPNAPFDYSFVDEEYDQKFRSEERVGSLITMFSILAIVISCLGLFGLASFVAEKRTKEIGIRKTLGASTSSLWGLLSKDFVSPVLIASILSIPFAYYLLDIWLTKFEYAIHISWWYFVITSGVALLVAIITVSYQALKAALLNPVNSLKSE
ncbi:FtsX-like permease family protein [Fulvivirga lutimaris]|uniref:FtsX-like permease family protein n=1 Tax=Fulvivirga lutimaris TaxID=1819566 RepID=UPI0012BB5AC5|nr:FtsX-like permease family protein [Fulvivirga lutimaris]MTI41338.1 ABC transporter permease [Fulvivirga lutimaris]